jgi:glycyl-tRNA synthetase
LTVDHQSLEDGTITIRDRDSMKQERMSVEEIKLKIRAELDIKSWLNS